MTRRREARLAAARARREGRAAFLERLAAEQIAQPIDDDDDEPTHLETITASRVLVDEHQPPPDDGTPPLDEKTAARRGKPKDSKP